MNNTSKKTFTKEHTLIVKGLAVGMMLFYHLFQWQWQLDQFNVSSGPLTDAALLNLAGFGKICVAIFVFLTGFGITKSLKNTTSLKDAYKASFKRFGKLLLGFIAVYISLNAVWFFTLDYKTLYGTGKQTLLFILADAVGLSDFFGTPSLVATWWYMPIAYSLIFLIPLFAFAVRKIGPALIPLAIIFTYIVPTNTMLEPYIVCAACGVCAAEGDWLDKLLNIKIPRILQWLMGTVLLVGAFLLRQNAVNLDYFTVITEPVIAIILVWIFASLIGSIPILKKVPAFIGIHSMNIFLVHHLFCTIFTANYLYSLKYPILIWLVLLIVSLLWSIILELIKKAIMKLINYAKQRN